MNQKFYEKLAEIVSSERICIDEPMQKHTTFRIGGMADMFVFPKLSEVKEILMLAKQHQIPVTVIGNGSNLLVGDKGIRGLVLAFGKGADEIKIEGCQMTTGAGTLLSKLAAEALKQGLTGLEFAAGIPGTVGGALVMNAGAYGGEIKDVLTSAKVLTPEGEIKELSGSDLELSYRHSCIPEKGYIVLEVTIELQEGKETEIREKMTDFRNRRIEKQPLEYPSAGSTFKRPKGYFAGKLIEDAGLRGYTVGDAQVSQKHCGFVINKGNATASDVCRLMADIEEIVYDRFGVHIEPEVKRIGEF